jgi:hypothetical protein
MRCFFCSSPATFGPFDGVCVCDSCTKLIGAVALRNPVLVWAVADSAPIPVGSYSEMISEVKRLLLQDGKLVEQAREPSAGAPARLVDTFTSERLFHFAVQDCAHALIQGTKDDVKAALGRLLAPPLLKSDGLVVLKRMLLPIP